jgi:hypothetical protein
MADLIVSAKKAIEQKELRRSIRLINEIQNRDPYNKEAQQLRTSVQSHLKQDLAKVRLYLSSSGQTYEEFLIQKARSLGQRRLYSRAEKSLRSILDVDPGNEEAKNLLSLVSSLQRVSQKPTTQESGARLSGGVGTGRRVWIWVTLGLLVVVLGGGALWSNMSRSKADQRAASKGNDVPREQALTSPSDPHNGLLVFFIVPAVGARVSLNDGPPRDVPKSVELQPGPYRLRFTASGYLPETVSGTVAAGERRTVPVILKAGSNASPQAVLKQAAAAGTGTLALNAQTPALL